MGREAEQRSLDQLLSAARVGRSGVLVLTGEAGIGKTTLLDHVAHRVQGMQVLRAVGSTPERDVAFGGLLQLLRPVLGLLDQIPAPQAEALAAALAVREGQPGDRFAIGAATLSLLSRCAEDSPVVLLLDDAHDLDEPSLEAIVFAARRLMTDPVAVLAAVRSGSAPDTPLSALPTLELVGLGLDEATQLLATAAGGAATPDLVAQLHRATAGNPLAMLELASDTETLASLTPEVPMPVPDVLAGTFGRRLALLDRSARTVLLLAALSDGDLAVITEAAARLGVDSSALGPAQDSGLVSLSAGSVRFRHPLVRSSVYAATPIEHRRAAHRAVADSLPPSDLERRTWHRAEAAVGFDDGLADELDLVAQRARNRRAFSVAATAQERAALLSSDRSDRAARLVAAGQSAWWAGQVERALGLLDRGAGTSENALLGAKAAGLRGSIGAHTGSLEAASKSLMDAAHRLRDHDPEGAVGFLVDGIQACFWMADVPRALTISSELDRLSALDLPVASRVLADLGSGMTHVLAGGSGIGAIRRAVARLQDPAAWPDDPLRVQLCLIGVLFMRERGSSRDLLGRIESDLRSRSALGTLPGLLLHTARDEATADRWQWAMTRYEESISLARESGQTTQLTMSLAGLAWLQARRGEEKSCRDLTAEALALAERHRIHTAALWTCYALGDLELGLGKVDRALAHYERLDRRLQELQVLDVDLVPGPERAECLLRAGRAQAALHCARDYLARAEAKGQSWARARAQRAMAMVGEAGEAERRFTTALELHQLNPDTFEEARTRLAFGETLRRQRRRVAARPLLRAAVAAFERIGAEPWAVLASQELVATGETPSQRGDSAISRLTGQELQISRMLASGRTTRETAAALFLSPKTVEYHLRHVYTKLDIHSRAELTEALAEPASED